MSRKLPRSFFWVDQKLIREGLWLKLCPASRLSYIALAASCDRDGVSIWSRSKLMELAGVQDPEQWQTILTELETFRLIEPVAGHSPAAIRLLTLGSDGEVPRSSSHAPSQVTSPGQHASPLTVHTHTTVYLGGSPDRTSHAEPRAAD
jgi:hypothetical protein